MGVVDAIKADAFKSNTKIQSSDELRLEKIFNAMFFMDKNIEEEAKFVRQVMTRGLETQERFGLHASSLIVGDNDYCVREQVLSLLYKQLQGEQINAGLKRIFEEGNSVHEKWQRLFIRAGYSKAKHLDVSRYNEEYMISYTPDIICKIKQFYDGPMVGEVKSMNTFQFKDMIKKGLSHPSAKKQLQWYMHLSKIHKGFALTEDKNDQNFKIELYDYDSKMVVIPIERAEEVQYYYKRVLNERKMVSRPPRTKMDSKRCIKCAMKDACYGVGIGRVKLEKIALC